MTTEHLAIIILLIVLFYREACHHLAEGRWEERFDKMTNRVQAGTLTDLIRNLPTGRMKKETKQADVPAVPTGEPHRAFVDEGLDAASTVRAMAAQRDLTE